MDKRPERPGHPTPDRERTVPPAGEGPCESIQDAVCFLHRVPTDLPSPGGGSQPPHSPAKTGSHSASAGWSDWPDPGGEERDGGAGELGVSLH